jgi:glycosyltransferase involved in cell wall biosynthesis
MAAALRKHCGDVAYIGPLHPIIETLVGFGFQRTSKSLLRKNFVYEESSLAARGYARVAARKLAGKQFDVVFAPAGVTETAFLETDIPVVLAADATYARLAEYYPEFSNVAKWASRDMNRMQQLALDKASQVIFASSWAAQSAIEDYDVDPRKVCVIPFGANLDAPPAKERVLRRKKSVRCRLLFVGINWQRKGGDIAYETLVQLEQMGIEAELLVCGCSPPEGRSHPRMKVVPFLDKNDDQQRKRLEELYLTADFFLLPSRQECYGIVFCEASAFGIPIITTDTGGISEIVRDGENGFLLQPTDEAASYAQLIASIYRDDERYYSLVEGARAAFDSRLNWDTWGLSVKKMLAQVVGPASPST